MQVLQFVITTCAELGETRGAAELALQLFLTAAGAACEVPGLQDIAYELFEQASSPRAPAAPSSAGCLPC